MHQSIIFPLALKMMFWSLLVELLEERRQLVRPKTTTTTTCDKNLWVLCFSPPGSSWSQITCGPYTTFFRSKERKKVFCWDFSPSSCHFSSAGRALFVTSQVPCFSKNMQIELKWDLLYVFLGSEGVQDFRGIFKSFVSAPRPPLD